MCARYNQWLKKNKIVGITGIDTSESLLEEAQKRLGKKVDLNCQSVSELDIGKKFDVAYSRGGAWTFVNYESETMLASHIFTSEDIQTCNLGTIR